MGPIETSVGDTSITGNAESGGTECTNLLTKIGFNDNEC